SEAGFRLRRIWPFIHEPVAQHTHHTRVVENSGPTAHARVAVAKYVVGETQPRSEAFPVRVQRILGHSGVAGNTVLRREENARRCVRINSGPRPGGHRCKIHLRPSVSSVAPRKRRLVPQAEIESEAAGDTIVVLRVYAHEVRPVVLELTRTLL